MSTMPHQEVTNAILSGIAAAEPLRMTRSESGRGGDLLEGYDDAIRKGRV
jgi:hypothetical protein